MITQLAKMVVVSSVRLQIRGAGVVFAFASSLRVSFTNKALKPNKQPQKKIWSENRAVREIPAVVPVAPALVPVRSGGISGLPVLSPVHSGGDFGLPALSPVCSGLLVSPLDLSS